jgi:hypothetical protein
LRRSGDRATPDSSARDRASARHGTFRARGCAAAAGGCPAAETIPLGNKESGARQASPAGAGGGSPPAANLRA